MIVGAIDLGSNTVKITVAEVGADLKVLFEAAEITRIGEGLDASGVLKAEAMDRTYRCLEGYVERCRALGAERIRCVATAGMRGAKNGGDFLARAKAGLGLDIEIIHGLREAELAFAAPAQLYGPGPVLVLDVGGRSTELVYGTAGQLSSRVSLEIGGVRMTERFLRSDPPTPEELLACRRFLEETYRDAPAALGATLVGVSGTVMALYGRATGEPEMAKVVEHGEGAWLSRAQVEQQLAELAALPAQQRLYGTVIPPGRHDVIVAGALVTLVAMERYGAERMRVSNRGVRYGLLFELARA